MSRPLDAHHVRIGDEEVVVLSVPGVRLPERLGLSAAERDVLLAIAQGKSNAAIAAAREVSVRTIANQVASASRKLGVSGRSELVAVLTDVRG